MGATSAQLTDGAGTGKPDGSDTTVIVKVSVALFPELSVAVIVTVVIPISNVLPEA